MADYTQQISQLLLADPQSQTEIARALSISQPSVSIIMRGNPMLFLKTGNARATRYYLRRPVHGQSWWPVYRVTAQGKAELFATLYSVYPQGFAYLLHERMEWAYTDSLPWWMDDMRPQGFIGRALMRSQPVAGLPDDLNALHDEDVLQILLHCPLDSVGNLLVGEQAYRMWLERQPVEPITEQTFLPIAAQAMAGWTGGSSAGGEQPKFLAQVAGHAVPCLIKFSAQLEDGNRAANRWADLLRAEHLALQILAGSGIAAATSWIVDHQANGIRRTFLCVERFDRTAQDGRRGLVSLRVLDAEFTASRERRWPLVVANLAAEGVIRTDDVPLVTTVYCYGKLIGNSDMHSGNLSFFLDGGQPLALAPIYDMLPMALSPVAGEVPQGLPTITIDSDIKGEYWRNALPLAIQFWTQLAQEVSIDPSFRQLGVGMLERLQTQIAPLIDRMV